MMTEKRAENKFKRASHFDTREHKFRDREGYRFYFWFRS